MLKKAINCINPQLIKMYKKSSEVETLQLQVMKYLPSHLKEKTTIASFDNGQLVLNAKTAAASTELRYLLPELRTQLRQKENLYQLVNIKVMTARF